MLEFSSLSVSTYDSASLAGLLTEHSARGWDVVSIVQTGTTVTAFLSRPVGGAAAQSNTAAATEPSPVPAAVPASTGDSGTSTVSPGAASSSASSTAGSGAAAPAGWYADPANRFELRYWDGDKWTEYVSRGGQQFTDPPVA